MKTEKAQFVLDKFDDDTIIKLASNRFFITRTQCYLWRHEHREMPSDLVEYMIDAYNKGYTARGERVFTEETVDHNHPAMKREIERFLADAAERGLEAAFDSWTYSPACACMGPQDGDPLCPCSMTSTAAHIVCKRTVVLNPGFELPPPPIEESRARILRALSHLQYS